MKALLEAKEESLKAKNEFERESKERRTELQKYEKGITKEEATDRKSEALEKREIKLNEREAELEKGKKDVEELHSKQLAELERISGMTSDQAKIYPKTVEDDVKHEMAVMVKDLENRAKEDADKKAKEIVISAIQRCAADHMLRLLYLWYSFLMMR